MNLKSLIQNLSRIQKITILFILQAIIIIIIAAIINRTLSKPKDRIDVVDDEGILKDVPSEEIELYEQALWNVISETNSDVDRNIVKDATIRENSYSETKNETGGTQASFIIDIDTIKQSYQIVLGWGDDGLTIPIIDCLPVSEAKYPDSVCYGTYRSSNDLSLYLPYEIESPYLDEYPYTGPELYIDGDEATHQITVTLNPCSDAEVYRQKAAEYLKTIPNIADYQINYEVTDGIDVVCVEDL